MARVEFVESESYPHVDVTDSTGHVRSFDEVVITTPLGWLKRNKAVFSPPLSPALSDAIDSISYGHLEKFIAAFPQPPFWHQADKPHPGFSHWMPPLYAASSNPKHWSQEAVSLAELPGLEKRPFLLFYTFGENSLHLTSALNGCTPGQSHKILLEFFRPYFERLPGYIDGHEDCIPTEFLATNWSNDPLTYGSYCNFQTGTEQADIDIISLRRGMPENRVWLAGEHTAPFVALGTVTGAYWSGERVAQNIIEAWGGRRTDPETVGDDEW